MKLIENIVFALVAVGCTVAFIWGVNVYYNDRIEKLAKKPNVEEVVNKITKDDWTIAQHIIKTDTTQYEITMIVKHKGILKMFRHENFVTESNVKCVIDQQFIEAKKVVELPNYLK